MKVEVEKQPDFVSTLQIELSPEQVTKEWNAIADNFVRHAKIPGYRPGKAPRKMIEAKFKKEIEEEVTKKLVSKSYRDAIAEKQLRVVSLTNLEDVQIGDDKTMRFRATVITAPEFDLPDYKNITVQLPPLEVTDQEIDAAMERLREQPADFVELEHEKEHAIEQAKESQIIKALQEQTQFDLPPPLLRNETRRALGELVQQNRQRGVPDEMLKSKEKELVQGAGSLAAHRLKTNFILHRIAEAGKIQVTSEEVEERIRKQAARYNVSVEKMRKEIDQHEGINSLVEEILLGKTIDFLEANVSIKTTTARDQEGRPSKENS